MKKITLVLIAVLLLASMLLMSSCQLSQMLGKDEETTDGGSAGTQAPVINDNVVYEKMDFLAEDFNVFDYITLGAYKNIAVTVEKVTLSDEEFEAYVDNLLSQEQYYVEITDRATAEGDTLNIDFEGYLDGVQFSGGTAAGQTIELSENSGYIDGFADGLVGVMPGTTVDLDLTFPENYHSADLAGKAVVFKVKVNYIQGEVITPEFTDEFVKEYTEGDYTDVASFTEYFRTYIIESLEAENQSVAMEEMWETILMGSEVIEYPEQQVNYYKQYVVAQYESTAAYYGIDAETLMMYYGITEETILETARAYTKDDLLLAALIKTEGFELTDDEFNEKIAKYSAEAGMTAEEFIEAYAAYYGETYLAESFLWDKIITQLFEWANVTVLE